MRTPHPFGELLSKLRARQAGLTQARLAALAGYDPAVIARMGQGQKDLTGPQARERVIQVIRALDAANVLNGVEEANALLGAADLPPLFAGNYVEAELMQQLAIHRRGASDRVFNTPLMPRHNLPAQLTSFIGRAQELAELKRFLLESASNAAMTGSQTEAKASRVAKRLITLTGLGGVGKTRLALALATAVQLDFSDGIWWVPLATCHDPSMLAQTLTETLRLSGPPQASLLSVLVRYLESRRVLLVLDNCEHVIDACADLVAHLLRSCPDLHILITSREALHVPGEVAFQVPPLNAPAAVAIEANFTIDLNSIMDFDAVRLFTERAQSARAGFHLAENNVVAVAHICERLDGIPLALELAAALMQILTAEEIASRIDSRFMLLRGGYRTVSPRHQTLSNAVDWSYALLSRAEQILLARLSVFADGWDAAAAEAICADPVDRLAAEDAQALSENELKREDVLPALHQLVNKSLVVVDGDSTRNLMQSTRYRLLRTIHEYAAEKLRERNEQRRMQHRHLNYWLAFAEAADAQLTTHTHVSAMASLRQWRDELRAALQHAEASGSTDVLLRLAAALQSFWRGGARTEGTLWLDKALAHAEAAPASLRLAALFAWSWTFPDEGAHLARYRPIVETSLAASRADQDQMAVAQGLTLLSDIARAVDHDDVQARDALEAAWSILSTMGNRRATSIVRHKMGVVLAKLDVAAAEAWMRDSINLFRAMGENLFLSTTLADLAWLIEAQNPLDSRLQALWNRAVEAAGASGDLGLQGEFLFNLGHVELRVGNRDSAALHLAQALDQVCEVDTDTDDKVGIYWTVLALCQVDRGRAWAAMNHYLQVKQQLADKRGIAAAAYFLGVIQFEGEPHDLEQARHYFEHALRMWRELGVTTTRYGYGGVTRSLLALGQVYSLLGHQSHAIELLDESLRLCQASAQDEFLAALYLARGYARLQQNQLEFALSDFGWVWNRMGATGQPELVGTMALAALGEIAWRQEQVAQAAYLSGYASTKESDLRDVPYSGRIGYEQLIAAAKSRLTNPTYAAAWQMGRSMTLDEIKATLSTLV